MSIFFEILAFRLISKICPSFLIYQKHKNIPGNHDIVVQSFQHRLLRRNLAVSRHDRLKVYVPRNRRLSLMLTQQVCIAAKTEPGRQVGRSLYRLGDDFADSTAPHLAYCLQIGCVSVVCYNIAYPSLPAYAVETNPLPALLVCHPRRKSNQRKQRATPEVIHYALNTSAS